MTGTEVSAEDAFRLVAARWEQDVEPFNAAELSVVRVWWLERTAEERLASTPCPRRWVDAVDRVSSEDEWDAFAEDVEGWLDLTRTLPRDLESAAALLREANGGELSGAARAFLGEHLGAYEELVCSIASGLAGFTCDGHEQLRLRPGRGEVRWIDGEPWVRPRSYPWERLARRRRRASTPARPWEQELARAVEALLREDDDEHQDQDDDGPPP